MSPDSSFDTTFDTSFGSDISTSTPVQGPRIQTERIRKRLVMLGHEEMETSTSKVCMGQGSAQKSNPLGQMAH